MPQRAQVNVAKHVDDSCKTSEIDSNVVQDVNPHGSNESSFVHVVSNVDNQSNVDASGEASEATTTSPNKRKMLVPRKLKSENQRKKP